jgi:subtilase family serine protease
MSPAFRAIFCSLLFFALVHPIEAADAAAEAAPLKRIPVSNLVNGQIDPSHARPLVNHHPLWANPANDSGPIAPYKAIQGLTLVLTRPAEQQQAFEQFLADQQNPNSANYHRWLTPAEVGENFGLSDADINAITGWLQSQNLNVDWIAPSKVFIGFSGTAADVSRALQTELRTYRVNGKQLISVSSDPLIPEAIGPAVKAIHGLYTIADEPQHIAVVQSPAPQITEPNGSHFIGPGDFAKIYDLPEPIQGTGITIGIVGRSRTDTADFDNFKSLAGSGFSDPTEVVPIAFGGLDPGPAYTSPPGSGVSIDDQGEATLDVQRAGSVASGAKLLLVVATQASGGVEADAQYFVNTTPLPAQIITISFGACESAAGPSGVTFWDTLFQQAAAEGISSFVSSGDSGASGCDAAFQAPPTSPQANSPNYICSSSYATCVGGTEFNDLTNPSTYWAGANGSAGTSAVSYIPEGGWNESWSGTTSTVASSGGGVSAYVVTPSWQKGVMGVPSSDSGRYTPDVSFSSSRHDGYFGCFAASGASCVSSGGSYYFTAFSGTSAAAPSMAGITALLDQNLGGAQGNLNPGIYQMTFSVPTAFHDATLASSGVTTCDLNTPSMCNNSIPGPAGLSGGQPGYAVGTGYDEVTGVGSLDAATFVNAYGSDSKVITPTVYLSTSATVATNQPLSILITVAGAPYSPFPSGNVTATIGSYTSAATPLSSGTVYIDVPAGALPVGNYTLTVAYKPDSASAPIFTSASTSQPLTVIIPPKVSPTLTLTPSQQFISNSQVLTVGVVVNAVQYYPSPTGSVILTSGAYTSAPAALVAGGATITVPAGSLAVGDDTLTVTYTPDAASSSSYLNGSNFVTVDNEGATITPSVFVAATTLQPTTAQSLTVRVTVNGFTGNPTPTGKVILTCGTYTSVPAVVSSGIANFTLAPGTLPPGLDTITATYTPDAQSSTLYSSTTGSNQVGITLAPKIAPVINLNPLTSSPTTVQPLSLAITLSGGAGYAVPSGGVRVGAGNFGTVDGTLSGGASTVILPPGSFSSGANTITVEYFPDPNASYLYNQVSATTSITVAKSTPTVTLMPASSSVSTTDSLSVTVAVSGGTGTPNATGSLTVTSGTYSSGQLYLTGGIATISIPPGSLSPGSDALTATYAGDNNYATTSATASVAVALPAGAAFIVNGTYVQVARGTTGASTITVAPTSGFVGAVTLAAAITAQPPGAQDLPTVSFGSTSPVTLTGFNPATATLTVGTTPATSAGLDYPPRPSTRWYSTGGAVFACLLFFLAPAQRRRGLRVLSALFFFAIVASSIASCGGGSSQSGDGSSANTGTTPGQYAITITGTSGGISASKTITLTVQ